MPRLWTDTMDGHRRAVRDAVLDAAAELVGARGPGSVTMSQLAQTAGIGRATLYKYFPDVDSVLAAWHERQVREHLERLVAVADGPATPRARLDAVLTDYAQLRRDHRHRHGDVGAALHRGEHVVRAHEQLRAFVGDLVRAAVSAGEVRTDVPPDELADFCLHALAAAQDHLDDAATRRLLVVTLSALRAPSTGTGKG